MEINKYMSILTEIKILLRIKDKGFVKKWGDFDYIEKKSIPMRAIE
jgi:hypothetical protein